MALNSDQSTSIVGSHIESNNKGVEWDSIDIRVTHWLGGDSKRIQLELHVLGQPLNYLLKA